MPRLIAAQESTRSSQLRKEAAARRLESSLQAKAKGSVDRLNSGGNSGTDGRQEERQQRVALVVIVLEFPRSDGWFDILPFYRDKLRTGMVFTLHWERHFFRFSLRLSRACLGKCPFSASNRAINCVFVINRRRSIPSPSCVCVCCEPRRATMMAVTVAGAATVRSQLPTRSWRAWTSSGYNIGTDKRTS